MSNNDATSSKKENNAVTGVEVVKDDTVVYEDGDFEEYNAEHDLEVDTDATLGGDDQDKDSDKEDKSDKKGKTSKADKKDNKSSKKAKADKKDDAEQDAKQEDKSSITMAGIYQWASKLKDDFKSDANGMTQDVSEKATAMMLTRLIELVDIELKAFDKSLEMAKKLVATAEDERKKIASRKEKYQGMIDKLDQE